MKEFKIGDIVFCTSEFEQNKLIKNKFGKVITLPYYCYEYGIEFYNYIDGHGCRGRGKYNYCWDIPKKYLILINKYKLQKLLCKKSVKNIK